MEISHWKEDATTSTCKKMQTIRGSALGAWGCTLLVTECYCFVIAGCVRGSAGCSSHYPSVGARIEENPAAYLGGREEVEDTPFLPCPIPVFPLPFTLFGDWAQRCWLCEERGDLKGKCCFKAEIITASLNFSFFLFPAGLLLVQRKGGL